MKIPLITAPVWALIGIVVITLAQGQTTSGQLAAAQECLDNNGTLGGIVSTTIFGLTCAIFVHYPNQTYQGGLDLCNSFLATSGAVCNIVIIPTLDDLNTLKSSGIFSPSDTFYVGLMQTDTSEGAADGWSWVTFNSTEPASPPWAPGAPDDPTNTKSWAAYEGGNGFVDVDNSTFGPTGFLCQCGDPNVPIPIPTTTSTSTTIASTSPTTTTTTTTTKISTTTKKTTTTTTTTTTKIPATTSAMTTAMPATPATIPYGCIIKNVDPESQVSSVKYLVVGIQSDCGSVCATTTAFDCTAYTWAGPGTGCVLYGPVDQKVNLMTNSKYYLTDMQCVKQNLAMTTIAVNRWEKTDGGIDAASITATSHKTMMAQNQAQCETFCVMNMLRPKCDSYAFAPTLPVPNTNCYLFSPGASSAEAAAGSFDLYQLL